MLEEQQTTLGVLSDMAQAAGAEEDDGGGARRAAAAAACGGRAAACLPGVRAALRLRAQGMRPSAALTPAARDRPGPPALATHRR